MSFWSDTHCSYSRKHKKDFTIDDWYHFFMEHGAKSSLAKIMANNKLKIMDNEPNVIRIEPQESEDKK